MRQLGLLFLDITETSNFPSRDDVFSTGVFDIQKSCGAMANCTNWFPGLPELFRKCDGNSVVGQIQN
jgi:hypothetical protein